MLFNSYEFVLLFLPLTLLLFFRIGTLGHHRVAVAMLVGASLFFYGWWNPAYLGLILLSILFNYAVGVSLTSDAQRQPGGRRRLLLTGGIVANLGVLAYYKYAGFFVQNINTLTGSDFTIATIALPLAISFFTFQQITYLVDAYQGKTREYDFLHYCLFVTFFPQLIAGPIVHHREMLPQFARDAVYRPRYTQLAVGITIFTIGLFKKVVLADGVAVYATPVFDAAAGGASLTFLEAWGGALAYTFQLYFDFSGYSDMAVGVSNMFGIRLPANFNSPYKATNIVDFWRRWHMTLSRFLRDYIYIPLGGNRRDAVHRYRNLLLTMLLGGLWHGANWTFVLWGALHGALLVVNHAWHRVRRLLGHDLSRSTPMGRHTARALTFIAVVLTWVLFRAQDLDTAGAMYGAMLGLNGIVLPHWADVLAALLPDWIAVGDDWAGTSGSWKGYRMCAWLLLAVWLLPNTQQLMRRYRPTLAPAPDRVSPWLDRHVRWRMSVPWAIGTGLVAAYATFQLSNISEFLYFQF